jgi:hypothetical protein
MSRHTEQIVQQLATQLRPVRPLHRPYFRTVVWLAISVTYVAAAILLVSLVRAPASRGIGTSLSGVEIAATLATGAAAAAAAFMTVVPGRSRWWALLPVLPLFLWLGTLAPACMDEFNVSGFGAFFAPHSHWCIPFMVLFGIGPALAITVMLRRGAPLTPHLTAALGGLAAAGIGNAGVRFIHPEDVSVMLLVWHVGGVMALCAVSGSAGRSLFNWRAVQASESAGR